MTRFANSPTSNVARCHEPRSDGRASDPTIVPTCEILAPEMAVETLTKPGNPNLVAVRQDFTGAFSGRALLIFPERGSLELMRAILGRQLAPHDIRNLEDEALRETGNVILNSWLATLANILKKSLKLKLPAPGNHAFCSFTSSSRSANLKCAAMSLS